MNPPDPITRLNAALEGRYRIESELGEGGMATVYLADDIKHERKVALKVLKPELAAVVGAGRFLAEIKTTANLSHPHILPLHDSGEADGFLFYVMPHVEGESLRDRLDREHLLPVDDAVQIAKNVAEALDYAHRQGVIHRDIKPANILLQDGKPVLSDFGIALAVGNAGQGRMTETGLSMGTPHYMSPEQATGELSVGAATDIYALGCVLYEMLVGEPPYTGSTAQAILGKIIAGELATATKQRASVPANVDAAIRKALEKVPADRFMSARELAKALGDPGFRHGEMVGALAAVAPGPWKRVALAMTGVAAVAVALAFGSWLRPVRAPSVLRYDIVIPGTPPRFVGLPGTLAISPGGGWLAYADIGSENQPKPIRIQRRDQLEWTPVLGTEGGYLPRFSPDGTRMAYVDGFGGDLRVVSVEGGPSVSAMKSAGSYSWIDDESLVVASFSGDRLFDVPASGDAPEEIWASDSLRLYGIPSILPGGRAVVVPACSACPVDRTVHVLDLETGEARSLYPAMHATYVEPGILVLVRDDGSVLAAPFDLGTLELRSSPVPIMDGVSTNERLAAVFISSRGTLLTALGPRASADVVQARYEAVWISRTGEETPVSQGWRFQLAPNFGHALSPDGSRFAIGLRSNDGDDVWVKELPDGPLARLTLDSTDESRPKWSADGRYIWYQSTRTEGPGYDLLRRRADGADAATYFPIPGRDPQEPDPSPDGEWMVVRVGGVSGSRNSGRDIVAYRTDDDSTEVPLLVSEYDEVSPRLSPDGRWLAYVSSESGRFEVYVRPFPNVQDGRWPISTRGGTHPLWKRDGSELYYVAPETDSSGRMMTVAHVEAQPEFSVRSREELFELSPRLLTTAAWEPVVDVTGDGERFLMMMRLPGRGQDGELRLVIVENWFEELKRLVPN